MFLSFRKTLVLSAIVFGLGATLSVIAEDEVFDRLDGKGPSGKRVDVIEWEGNLEVHVYPKGSIKGLSAKLDDRVEGKKVMVIGYRFGAKERPLVRRAILGVPFQPALQAFSDSSEKDFDKLALSNRLLTGKWKPYTLDPAPAQWYPDGDDRNREDPIRMSESKRPGPKARKPASLDEGSLNDYDF
jgi:hypothetical protein